MEKVEGRIWGPERAVGQGEKRREDPEWSSGFWFGRPRMAVGLSEVGGGEGVGSALPHL